MHKFFSRLSLLFFRPLFSTYTRLQLPRLSDRTVAIPIASGTVHGAKRGVDMYIVSARICFRYIEVFSEEHSTVKLVELNFRKVPQNGALQLPNAIIICSNIVKLSFAKVWKLGYHSIPLTVDIRAAVILVIRNV